MKRTKARQAAKGQDCVVNLPMACNYNPETTVLAHVGKGSAKRNDDNNAVYACFNCHGAIDRNNGPFANYFLSDDIFIQKELNDLREVYIKRALKRMEGVRAA